MHSDEPGSYIASKGEITYKIEKYDDFVFYVAEKNGLAERTYKSILTLINTLFETEKAGEYFKSNYSNMQEGNKSFEGFEIVINPQDIEKSEFGEDKEIVKVIINKEIVNSKIGITNQTKNIDNSEIEVTKENKANNSTVIFIVIAIAVLVIISLVVIFLKKNK